MTKSKSTTRRSAVGYCRTSGEGQRDNTSIPSQKQAIESWCQRENYQFIRHYVDEAKSGAKIAGRDGFQRLMKDAVAGKFDIAVVYQISRWGRDGIGIMDSARTLQRDFNIDVVDTAGHFDTRDRKNVLGRHIFAGMADQERILILERTMGGRIARAKAGRPWCGCPPAGRGWDKERRKWYITDQGREIAAMLKRYSEGESVTVLGKEYEQRHGKTFNQHYFKTLFSKWIHGSQLAGPYTIHFKSPDIGLEEKVTVPGMPEVVTPALLAKVKARLIHNMKFNRADAKQYLLSGFIYCVHCGRALSGQTTSPEMNSLQYYRHDVSECPALWMSVRGELLTGIVLDYLYGFFLDEPAFNKAVQRALPTTEQREELTRQRDAAGKRLAKVQKQIDNLAAAVSAGVDPAMLVRLQEALKTEQTRHQQELDQLNERLAAMPSAEQIGQAATWCRLDLIRQHTGKDWRKLPHDDVKRFLHHLFGDSPRLNKTGLFVDKNKHGNLTVVFRGLVEIPDSVAVVDGKGRVVSTVLDREAKRVSRRLKELALTPVSDYFRFSTE